MQSGRYYNKLITTQAGTNLTNSSSQAYPQVEVISTPTATSNNLQYDGEDDSQKVLSGAGGDGGAGSPEKAPQRWGYTAPSGSRIEVNDTAGAERVEVVHRSGAGIVIEPDGAVYIASKSTRGAGVSAPFGDVFITAAGDIVIKGGGSITIQTPGDLSLDVGGTLQARCENFNLVTKNYNATIDGPSSTNVTNDQSVVVGGIDRKSVAGDQREQTSGKRIIDVGSDYTNRIGGKQVLDVQGTSTHSVKGDHKLQTNGKTTITSNGDMDVNTGGKYNRKTGGDDIVEAGSDVGIVSGGDMGIAASGSIIELAAGHAQFGSLGTTQIIGDNAILAGAGQVNVLSVGAAKVVGSNTDIHGGTIANHCGTFLSKPISGDGGSPTTATVPMPAAPGAPNGPDSAEDPKDAEVMEANDVVDSLTSARKYPEYPNNGVTESANRTSTSTISYDETPQAKEVMDEYSGGNQGNSNPSQSMETFDNLPEDSPNRDSNITSSDPEKEIPPPSSLNAKISKYFTLGQLIKAKHSHPIPPGSYESVVKNHILAANNILDPIKEKFPDLVITSAYRSNSPNHRTGRAIDMVVESRSMTKHAEIARFARDSLPCDQVFLEKNTSGRTHVHIRVSPAGSKTSPSVMTCGDAQCRSRVSGIQVEWLARRAN